jgi:tRNA(Ile)-lysidine synthase
MNLIKKVQENIFRHELFERGARIVVGVSGGPDSVCLLDVLYKLKKKYDLEIIIAHVNYGLRGKDSAKDEKLVKDLSGKYSLPIEVLRVRRLENRKVRKSEESFREIRYNFFKKVLKKNKADFIAVGHNLNDQAETVLLRILRGTGLRGLAAIKFKNEKIIRPLLNIPRKEIFAYLRKNRVAYRIDKTNLGEDFMRNKIRNNFLPLLEKNFNPNVQNVLYKLSQTVSGDYDFINKYSAEWLKVNKSLRISKLIRLHPAILREIIRLAIEKHIPSLREIEAGHIDEVLKIVSSTKSKRQIIKLKKLKIVRINDRLIIRKG